MTDLLHQHCVPCEGGTLPLNLAEEKAYLSAVPGWEVSRTATHQLVRDWAFSDFTAAVAFIDQVARLAESQGHHPNLYLHDYKHVKVELYTHAVGGLSVNDFILAAKVNQLQGM